MVRTLWDKLSVESACICRGILFEFSCHMRASHQHVGILPSFLEESSAAKSQVVCFAGGFGRSKLVHLIFPE